MLIQKYKKDKILLIMLNTIFDFKIEGLGNHLRYFFFRALVLNSFYSEP